MVVFDLPKQKAHVGMISMKPNIHRLLGGPKISQIYNILNFFHFWPIDTFVEYIHFFGFILVILHL